MRAFNIAFLTLNLLMLALVVFMYWNTRSRTQHHFDRLKPIMMRYYSEIGLKLPHPNPQNMDELLEPLELLERGLSK